MNYKNLNKECILEVLQESLLEGFDPLSQGPNIIDPTGEENPYAEWNAKMRTLEEEEVEENEHGRYAQEAGAGQFDPRTFGKLDDNLQTNYKFPEQINQVISAIQNACNEVGEDINNVLHIQSIPETEQYGRGWILQGPDIALAYYPENNSWVFMQNGSQSLLRPNSQIFYAKRWLSGL